MGNQKGLVQRIERMLEDGVGDAFARVFGGSIVPQEVESLLRREASDGVQTLPGDRFLAPNEYVITLSEADFQKVSADRDLTAGSFATHLSGYIREQGWQTYGEVVVRFEQGEVLHTGQYRARAAVNPDAHPRPSVPTSRPAQSNHAYTAEPGVPAMTDNPSYRGQGRPGDEYYEDQYGRPQQDPRAGAPDQRPSYPDQGGYPDPYAQGGYPPRPAYPDQGGYPDPYAQQGYSQGGYGAPGYDQGYRPAPQGYGPQGGQGYGAPAAPYGPPPGGGYAPPQADYGYGRPAPGRQEEPGYGGYQQPGYGRPDYGQPAPGGYGYEQGGYPPPAPAAAPDYNYGQDYGQPNYGGYAPPAGQGDYPAPAAGREVSLQLDDGSGRTYQLREGANVIGRGQDAQFRLPDTGVSRRHLEIRWDGQTAILQDLNSTNGTTVNNSPVQEWQLADGDVIRVGHSEIIVRVH